MNLNILDVFPLITVIVLMASQLGPSVASRSFFRLVLNILITSLISCMTGCSLEQRSPIFLAPGICFVECNCSVDGVEGRWLQGDSCSLRQGSRSCENLMPPLI